MDSRYGTFYLIVKPGKYGSDLKARLANKLPALLAGEVPIKVAVNVPRALFTRPQIQASITIPEGSVTAPVVNAEVLNNIQEIINQQLGFDVKVALIEAE